MPLGSLWQLAALPDMPSQPTIRELIRARADFPIVERGRKGATYVFDLDKAAAFVRANWGDARLRKPYGSPPAPDRQLKLF